MYGCYCSESGKLCIFIVHQHGGVFEQCIICPIEEVLICISEGLKGSVTKLYFQRARN